MMNACGAFEPKSKETRSGFCSLAFDKCNKPSGIKLIGSAGNRRKATGEEIELLSNKNKIPKNT
jgi:hypothetical protein